MTRLKWFKNYLTKNKIFRGLGRFLLFCLILLSLPVNQFYPLLIIFTVATFSFVYSIWTFGRLIWMYSGTDVYPNNTLTGYFIISMSGFLFGMTILTPAIVGLDIAANNEITLVSYLVTMFYSVAVWTFYLVARTASIAEIFGHGKIKEEENK